jgi:hypothetical protein
VQTKYQYQNFSRPKSIADKKTSEKTFSEGKKRWQRHKK